MVHQGGNQCALITNAYAPCMMEMAKLTPDLDTCLYAREHRTLAHEFGKFETRGQERYPD
jgi:hypothetical protein